MKANALWYLCGDSEPAWNVILTIIPAQGDDGPCIQEERTREMFLQEQEEAEFWENLRPQFWPDDVFGD